MTRFNLRELFLLASFSMIVGSCLNIVITTLTMESSIFGLCSENLVSNASPMLEFMPINYLLLATGLANYSRDYIGKLVQKGLKINDFKRLLLGAVIAGGSVYSKDSKYCIRFYGKDAVMHHIFAELTYAAYKLRPQIVRIESRGTYMTQFYNKSAVKELREYSPEFGARNGGVPTITYILEGNGQTKIEAARLLMSTSGWMTCSFSRSSGGAKVYPRLGLGSVTPETLNSEYMELMSSISLDFEEYTDKRYPNSSYLATYDTKVMLNFRKIGGFIQGITIKKGMFEGLEKNKLLSASCCASGKAFQSKDAACEAIMNSADGTSFEAKIYMDRIMLG